MKQTKQVLNAEGNDKYVLLSLQSVSNNSFSFLGEATTSCGKPE